MRNNTFRLLLFLLSLLSSFVYSQENLVLNPSFEDVNIDSLSCRYYQTTASFNAAIHYWTNPSSASSDLYHMSLDHSCPMYPLSTYNQPLLQPRTGDAMVGILTYTEELEDAPEPEEFKEYVQGQLSEPLIQGATYLVQFYVILGKGSVYVTNNIGFKFMEESYFKDTVSPLPLVPDFNYPTVIDLNDEWTRIEFEYTAPTAGIQYFIIGNFFGTDETTIQHRPVYFRGFDAYYLLDDVSVQNITASFDSMGPYCKNTVFTLPETSKEGHHGTWSPAINNQETTTYTFTPDEPHIKSTSLTIEITPPTLDLHFDLPTAICPGTDFVLPIQSEDGIQGSWSPEMNTQKTTTYTFHPTEENSCYRPFTATIQVFPLQDFTLAYSCFEGQVQVEAFLPSTENYAMYTWRINDHILADTSTSINLATYASLLHSGTTRIEATLVDPNGCHPTASLELEDIQQYCFIPKGISPNGDGRNDFFDIHTFGGVAIQIFNRNGVKVYEQTNYTNQWEGQSNSGTPLPSGTYFYQFITPQEEQISGWVEVMR